MSTTPNEYSDEQLKEWANKRSDDAGRLSRQLLAARDEILTKSLKIERLECVQIESDLKLSSLRTGCMADAINPDVTQRDYAPYWAAAFAVAIRAGNAERAKLAKEQLRRLGYDIDVASKRVVSRELLSARQRLREAESATQHWKDSYVAADANAAGLFSKCLELDEKILKLEGEAAEFNRRHDSVSVYNDCTGKWERFSGSTLLSLLAQREAEKAGLWRGLEWAMTHAPGDPVPDWMDEVYNKEPH